MKMTLEFTQDLTEKKTEEFLRLVHDARFQDGIANVPRSQYVLEKAKRYLLPIMAERTWNLRETVHVKRRRKKKARRGAAAASSAVPPVASAQSPEPKVPVSARLLRPLTPLFRSAQRQGIETLLATVSSTVLQRSTLLTRLTDVRGTLLVMVLRKASACIDASRCSSSKSDASCRVRR